MWHDFILTPPVNGQLVWVRRAPEDTVPLAAIWDGAEAQLLCGPQHWILPWHRATRWHPCDTAPAWPYPRNRATAWQDIYGFPPADGQSVWLRRHPEDTAAFRATFDANNLTFTLPTGWQLCWFDAWKWKA